MRNERLFSRDRKVYWPTEFIPEMNLLKGVDEKNQPVSHPLYPFFTGAMVLAASIGVANGRKREIGASGKQEIDTSTFASGQQGRLEKFIFLIPLLGNSQLGLEYLRPENEEELVREFERYAAGGLEMLRGMFSESAGKSPELIIEGLLRGALKGDSEGEGASSEKPKLF
jgi:hypothetical protein